MVLKRPPGPTRNSASNLPGLERHHGKNVKAPKALDLTVAVQRRSLKSEIAGCPKKCHHVGYATKKPTEDLLLNFDPSAALTGTAPSFSVMKAQREARKA